MMLVKNIAIVLILFSFSGGLKKENGEKMYSSGQKEDGVTKGNEEKLDAKETVLLEKLMARDAAQGLGMFAGMGE